MERNRERQPGRNDESKMKERETDRKINRNKQRKRERTNNGKAESKGEMFCSRNRQQDVRPHAVDICKTQSLVPGITHGILSKSKK